MNRQLGRLVRDGKNVTGDIMIFYKEQMLELGDVEIIGAFSVPINVALDSSPYRIELENGLCGEIVIAITDTTMRSARKAGFVGGLTITEKVSS